MFLKISQISLENTCDGVFCNKVTCLGPAILLNRESNTGAFLWNLRDVFYRTSPVAITGNWGV